MPSVGKRVLICEDDYLLALDFAATLSETGYEVIGPVHSAETALAEAYRHRPDVALIDIGLSGGQRWPLRRR
jgi:DNA-binding NarL/FixJ family response regulator